jgi:hypothetical protein
MKYENEFKQYGRDDFIRIVSVKYKVKKETAYRTWYKINQRLKAKPVLIVKPKAVEEIQEEKETKKPRFNLELKAQPDALRMLTLKDLMWYSKGSLTKKLLKQYGFNEMHILWLIDDGYNIA